MSLKSLYVHVTHYIRVFWNLKERQHSWILHTLLVANQQVLQHWKDWMAPLIACWLENLSSLAVYEKAAFA